MTTGDDTPLGGEPSELFERAMAGEDAGYLDVEAQLRTTPGTVDMLEEKLSSDDPVGRLMASVLLDWSERSGSTFETVERYLDHVERKFAGTVVGAPPVRGVVDNLTARFGAALAEYFALRLVKVPTAPAWRAQTALVYLERHPTPAATEALIRYATATSEPVLQASAVRAITAARDVGLPEKLAAERRRLAVAGRSLPAALAGLA